MSLQGILFIDLLGLGFMIWLLNLVRTKKLYISYAAIWFLAVLGMMILISVPAFLNGLPQLVGATYPASAISLLAFIFIFVILIFFSVQLSIISTRQTELIQAMAIKGLLEQEDPANQKISHSANQ
ncbi:MAG TPA: DUF2304 domain-containing protein [Anaerolineales bacterium]|nr:DUF2304 domain-containing protein [Anaerolineales bacterium]